MYFAGVILLSWTRVPWGFCFWSFHECPSKERWKRGPHSCRKSSDKNRRHKRRLYFEVGISPPLPSPSLESARKTLLLISMVLDSIVSKFVPWFGDLPVTFRLEIYRYVPILCLIILRFNLVLNISSTSSVHHECRVRS